jgi:plastocyanin
MDSLDSRSLRYIDCFAQSFSAPGQAYYRLSTAAGGCLPFEKEGAFTISIETRASAGPESHQHNVTVRSEGQRLIADPPNLKIETGDTVLWNTADPGVQGFAVQGESPEGRFDSSAMTLHAVYTHAFGTPGDYQWLDANGSKVSGIVSVRSLDLNDPEQCKKWVASLSEGALIMVRGEKAEPERVEILTGQTVFWAVERAPGISVTDSRLLQAEMRR